MCVSVSLFPCETEWSQRREHYFQANTESVHTQRNGVLTHKYPSMPAKQGATGSASPSLPVLYLNRAQENTDLTSCVKNSQVWVCVLASYEVWDLQSKSRCESHHRTGLWRASAYPLRFIIGRFTRITEHSSKRYPHIWRSWRRRAAEIWYVIHQTIHRLCALYGSMFIYS